MIWLWWIKKIIKGESQAQSCASMTTLNLIGSNPNQSNQISSIDDIRTWTLFCVTQLDSIPYGNEICCDLYHRYHRNIFRWTRTLLIHLIRIIDHRDNSNWSQNLPVIPSSMWWQPTRTKYEPLDAANYVIGFFYHEPR